MCPLGRWGQTLPWAEDSQTQVFDIGEDGVCVCVRESVLGWTQHGSPVKGPEHN